MILTAPHIPKATIRWSEHHKGRVLEAVFQWKGARVHIVTVYQHVWTTSEQRGQIAVSSLYVKSYPRSPAT